MDHTGYIYGPRALARRRRVTQLTAAVRPFAIAAVVLFFLLGAGTADYSATVAGLI